MQILIADKFPEVKQAVLREMGFEVVFEPALGPDDLPSRIGGAQILIVRSTRVSEQTIKAAERLQLIIRAGAGTNTIDCRAAANHGIAVANCPGKNAIAVAELAMGLVVALDRHLPDNVADIRRGVWNKARYGKARGLYGRSLGVAGTGRIGREVIRRAQGFGMNVLGFDIALTDELAAALNITRCDSLDDLCKQADIICVHLPLSAGTKHIFGAQQFEQMRPGTFVVNASRGGVVDDRALAKAVESGHIRAACDVYETEPSSGSAEFSSPLSNLPGFYGTHHIGASTEQAQLAVAQAALDIIAHWMSKGEILNCVNLGVSVEVKGQLIVRHFDKVGVLASVLTVLKEADINVEDMQNTIFEGGEGASAKIRVSKNLEQDVLMKVRECSPHVLAVRGFPSDRERASRDLERPIMQLYKQFASYYAAGSYPSYSERMASLLPDLLDHLGAKWLQNCIDIACGEGTFAVALSKMGFEVTGVDRSAEMLDLARKQAAEANSDVAFTRQDIRQLAVEDSYDLATCWYDSLNYVLTREDLTKVFQGVWRCLKPSGLFVFDMNTIYHLAVNWPRQECYVRQDKPTMFEVHRPTYDFERNIATLKITGFTKEDGQWLRMDEEHLERGYSLAEIRACFESVGFGERLCLGDLEEKTGLTPTSKRVWFVLEK